MYSVLMQRGHRHHHPTHARTQPARESARCNPQPGGVRPPCSDREERSFSFSALTPQRCCSTTSPCLLCCQGPAPTTSSLSSSAGRKEHGRTANSPGYLGDEHLSGTRARRKLLAPTSNKPALKQLERNIFGSISEGISLGPPFTYSKTCLSEQMCLEKREYIENLSWVSGERR